MAWVIWWPPIMAVWSSPDEGLAWRGSMFKMMLGPVLWESSTRVHDTCDSASWVSGQRHPPRSTSSPRRWSWRLGCSPALPNQWLFIPLKVDWLHVLHLGIRDAHHEWTLQKFPDTFLKRRSRTMRVRACHKLQCTSSESIDCRHWESWLINYLPVWLQSHTTHHIRSNYWQTHFIMTWFLWLKVICTSSHLSQRWHGITCNQILWWETRITLIILGSQWVLPYLWVITLTKAHWHGVLLERLRWHCYCFPKLCSPWLRSCDCLDWSRAAGKYQGVLSDPCTVWRDRFLAVAQTGSACCGRSVGLSAPGSVSRRPGWCLGHLCWGWC